MPPIHDHWAIITYGSTYVASADSGDPREPSGRYVNSGEHIMFEDKEELERWLNGQGILHLRDKLYMIGYIQPKGLSIKD